MAYDIYGNNLRRGFCEVHPFVNEEYPCSVCDSEQRERQKRQDLQRLEKEHYRQLQEEMFREMHEEIRKEFFEECYGGS